jgi:hypothetical protein
MIFKQGWIHRTRMLNIGAMHMCDTSAEILFTVTAGSTSLTPPPPPDF